MDGLPKCLICGKEIDFRFIQHPMINNRYAVGCGCFGCNLIVQSEGVIPMDVSEEDKTVVMNELCAEAASSYIETLRDHGIVDKESAEEYLQRCYTDATKRVKE